MSASSQSSQEEGVYSGYLKRVFENKPIYNSPRVSTPVTPSNPKFKRALEDAESTDAGSPPKRRLSPAPEPTEEPVTQRSTRSGNKQKSSITITQIQKRSKLVESWIKDTSDADLVPFTSFSETTAVNESSPSLLPAETVESDASSLKFSPSASQIGDSVEEPMVQVKAAPKTKATRKRVSKKKPPKDADFEAVSLPSTYFFDKHDKASQPGFNIFEDIPEPSANKEEKAVSTPPKSILKPAKKAVVKVSVKVPKAKKDEGEKTKKSRAKKQETPLDDTEASPQDTEIEPESQEKGGRVLRDRTNVSYVMETESQAAKRMLNESLAKKSPSSGKRSKTSDDDQPPKVTKKRATNAKRSKKSHKDQELEAELQELAKEYEEIKNYKLVVDSRSKSKRQKTTQE